MQMGKWRFKALHFRWCRNMESYDVLFCLIFGIFGSIIVQGEERKQREICRACCHGDLGVTVQTAFTVTFGAEQVRGNFAA